MSHNSKIVKKSAPLEGCEHADSLTVEYPYCPSRLFDIFEASGSLRSNVDAMATNIDGFGHMFTPVLDTDSEDIDEVIEQAIVDREASEDEQDVVTGSDVTRPSEEVVQGVKGRLSSYARRERMRLESFFDSCVLGMSFSDLRRQLRVDLEVAGNGFWEVTRDDKGLPYLFTRIPPTHIRMRKVDPRPVEVVQTVRKNPITFEKRTVSQRFRTYVMGSTYGPSTYFKQFGDPSVYSSVTGKRYSSYEELQQEENEFGEPEDAVKPAQEIIHFKVSSPISCYGVPRWVGELKSIMGVNHADHVNMTYFDNKGIPPMVFKVTGGRLSKETKQSLEDFIGNEVRGRQNYHKAMILEAEPSKNHGPQMAGMQTSQTRIEMEALTKFQQDDGQFLQYIELSSNRLGQTFRLPKLLRGDSSNANRATAQTALRFAEGQVFKPARAEFDFVMNSLVLPALGIRYHYFVSKGPNFTDPAEMTMMLKSLTGSAIVTPGEARDLAEPVVGKSLKKIPKDWTSRPAILTQAAVISKLADADGQNLYRESFELQQRTNSGEPTDLSVEDEDELENELQNSLEISDNGVTDTSDAE